MKGALTAIVTVLTAIVVVAIFAVAVAPKARTSNVIDSTFGGLALALGAATAPVTGAANTGFGNLTVGFPGSGSAFSNF